MTKILLQISRILVAILFIFSGLVKANDPLGLSYKMQEFFDLWQVNALNDYSLAFSVLIIAFEIIAGIALLIGWRMRIISWLLLLLIIFFTFLTGYAYLSGQFKDCGCFGDCLPITPLTSFLKDVILLVLIGFIFYHREKIRPGFSSPINNLIMILATIFSFAFQWYVLTFNPLVDCLPFKKGNNIPNKMMIPANSITDSFAIRFVYEKDGQQHSFSPAELPDDLDTYTFVERKDELVRKGNAEPAIKGFALHTADNIDITESILQDTGYVLLLFVNDRDNNVMKGLKGSEMEKALSNAKDQQFPVYVISNTSDNVSRQLNEMGWDYPVLKLDFTAYRTAARTNPALYLLNKGTVVDKWSGAEGSKALKYITAL
ncbi:MAG: DoxX family protein [Chitinophagaceae bacterium]|jgi:uncharacterized membrane protein YphA (DoxX/SURF4 family)|nr:DoxX family protein [Chitinophagaceae bacterium]